MILPIYAYGHPVLRKISNNIDKDYPKLQELIDNMFETMYFSSGVGLAAPQVGLNINLVVVDTNPYSENYSEANNIKQAFINPEIIERTGDDWEFNEGCLSLPEIREEVVRKKEIRITYYDENFVFHDKTFNSVIARVLQHEYDHLKGILFVDHLSSLKKTLLKRKLNDISKGKIKTDYKMIIPKKKR